MDARELYYLLETSAALVNEPHVAAARQIAREILEPQAEHIDLARVPATHIDALKAARLLGVTAPTEFGGGGASAAVWREISEILSGADGSTWFVAIQHRSLLEAILQSTNQPLRQKWLRRICGSEVLAGVALSHLRRPGAPVVTAHRHAKGWVINGQVSWITGWHLIDVFLLGAVEGDQVILCVVPAHEVPGLQASPPLELAAMQAAVTVALDLEDVLISSDAAVLIEPLEAWRTRDRRVQANASPGAFGLLRRIVRELANFGERRREPAVIDFAARLWEMGAQLRSRAYHLIDQAPAGDALTERLAIRASSLELVVRASTALVAAGSGASMMRSAAAQRLAREALFHLIQAQTAQVREATLRHLSFIGESPKDSGRT